MMDRGGDKGRIKRRSYDVSSKKKKKKNTRTVLVLPGNIHQRIGLDLQTHLVLQNLDQDVGFIFLTSFKLYF